MNSDNPRSDAMVKKKRQSDAMNQDGSSTDSSDERHLQSPTSGGCQHVKKAVDTARLRKTLKATGLANECSQCQKASSAAAAAKPDDEDSQMGFEYDNTLWLCLKCGTQLCGRSRNQHALQHFKTPHSDSHALTMNTRSFEIWCYECDNEVSANLRKNLLECVETVRKIAHKPTPPQPTSPATVGGEAGDGSTVMNIENKIVATWEMLRPLVGPPGEDGLKGQPPTTTTTTITTNNRAAIPLPPPPPPSASIPGMAKRVSEPSYCVGAEANNKPPPTTLYGLALGPSSHMMGRHPAVQGDSNGMCLSALPRVRGLANLGNTCFFNSVMQCLAQTPYLLEVLKELAEPGEEFTLPGGTFKFKEDQDVYLPQIKGTLMGWGGLTSALAQALEELQSGGGVFNPGKLFDKLCQKCPQFKGGDQHDAHELLRHLLESVRSEDLKRYQRVILNDLGYKDEDVSRVSEELRQKCKIYGNQAADRILRPEQVFRGFLVSTLTCQDCYNVSSRHEYFLDMSLPVSMDKPQPPQRRKCSPDNEAGVGGGGTSFYLNPAPAPPSGLTKAQQKKEKIKERKAKRAAKHQNNKLQQKVLFDGVSGAPTNGEDVNALATSADSKELSSSSDEESDADVEDNLIDDNVADKPAALGRCSSGSAGDQNGNTSLVSPTVPEKRGDSPENLHKDSPEEEDENDSGIATSPANNVPSNDEASSSLAKEGGSDLKNSLLAVGLSEKGANLIRQLSLGDGTSAGATAATFNRSNGGVDFDDDDAQVDADNKKIAAELAEQLHLQEQKQARAKMRRQRQRTQSYSDWSTTIAPRYQCEDNECSVQSCLNSFTGVELMTGNNKVGCEQCTRRLNGDDPKAKTVNTNATKQFLISSPPAVMILHLKRFQLGPRCIFRKLSRAVSFPLVLDIAPFCGSKVKNLPNIDRKQKKLLYALYGVVEHSGGMYGGHYTAYVKVRPKLAATDKRWKFMPQGSKAELDQDDEQRKKLDELLAKEQALRLKAANDSDDFSNSTSNSSSEVDEGGDERETAAPQLEGAVGGDPEAAGVEVPIGKWYFVSDSRVSEVNEEAVLKAQAYLLFYERIY